VQYWRVPKCFWHCSIMHTQPGTYLQPEVRSRTSTRYRNTIIYHTGRDPPSASCRTHGVVELHGVGQITMSMVHRRCINHTSSMHPQPENRYRQQKNIASRYSSCTCSFRLSKATHRSSHASLDSLNVRLCRIALVFHSDDCHWSFGKLPNQSMCWTYRTSA
jgi:hypothetical protein